MQQHRHRASLHASLCHRSAFQSSSITAHCHPYSKYARSFLRIHLLQGSYLIREDSSGFNGSGCLLARIQGTAMACAFSQSRIAPNLLTCVNNHVWHIATGMLIAMDLGGLVLTLIQKWKPLSFGMLPAHTLHWASQTGSSGFSTVPRYLLVVT